MMTVISTRIAQRFDTLDNWTAKNPTLINGELAIVSAQNQTRFKVGDGIHKFKDLPFVDQTQLSTVSAYADHISAQGLAIGYQTSATSNSLAAGSNVSAKAQHSIALGNKAATSSLDSFVFNGDNSYLAQPYYDHGEGTFNINPLSGLSGIYIGDTRIDNLLATKDQLPRAVSELSNDVGYALCADVDAAVAWLKKNKVQTLKLNDNSVETSADGGVAKLDDFFTESNSLLVSTIAAKSIPGFSSSSTYEVGEIVIYDGVAYKCVTAITTAEEWTDAHWTLATNSDLAARLKGLKSDGTATDAFATSLLGKPVAKEAIDEEIIEKGTAPDAHLEAPTDEHLKLILADNSVAYDSEKALPYKLTSVIGDRVVATMTLTAASTDITLPAIAANDTTVKDFILDVTNAYAVDGVATDAGINIPRTDFKLVTRDGESLTDVTTVKAGKSAFICFTQKSPVVVDGTTYPCWCVIQLPFGDPS